MCYKRCWEWHFWAVDFMRSNYGTKCDRGTVSTSMNVTIKLINWKKGVRSSNEAHYNPSVGNLFDFWNIWLPSKIRWRSWGLNICWFVNKSHTGFLFFNTIFIKKATESQLVVENYLIHCGRFSLNTSLLITGPIRYVYSKIIEQAY